MNKPKAPKDMNAPEFVEAFVAHMNELDEHIYTKNELRAFLTKPAPNPFTPDQIAWMREEQRGGYHYAAMDENETVKCFPSCPARRAGYSGYWSTSSPEHCAPMFGFLSEVLSWDDDEPLCFADYAPLEGADK